MPSDWVRQPASLPVPSCFLYPSTNKYPKVVRRWCKWLCGCFFWSSSWSGHREPQNCIFFFFSFGSERSHQADGGLTKNERGTWLKLWIHRLTHKKVGTKNLFSACLLPSLFPLFRSGFIQREGPSSPEKSETPWEQGTKKGEGWIVGGWHCLLPMMVLAVFEDLGQLVGRLRGP